MILVVRMSLQVEPPSLLVFPTDAHPKNGWTDNGSKLSRSPKDSQSSRWGWVLEWGVEPPARNGFAIEAGEGGRETDCWA